MKYMPTVPVMGVGKEGLILNRKLPFIELPFTNYWPCVGGLLPFKYAL